MGSDNRIPHQNPHLVHHQQDRRHVILKRPLAPNALVDIAHQNGKQRGTEVVVLILQSVEPRRGHCLPGVGVLCQTETVRRVTSPRSPFLSGLREPLQRVLAHRLQHPEAPFSVPLHRDLHEALVDQCGESIEDGEGVAALRGCQPLRGFRGCRSLRSLRGCRRTVDNQLCSSCSFTP